MSELVAFHRCAAELLHYLGFAEVALDAEQEVVALWVEPGFGLYLGTLDREHWFMKVDLGDVLPQSDPAVLARALRHNQPSGQPWQVVTALDQDGRLGCWLRLPCHGGDLSTWIGALEALLRDADELLYAS